MTVIISLYSSCGEWCSADAIAATRRRIPRNPPVQGTVTMTAHVTSDASKTNTKHAKHAIPGMRLRLLRAASQTRRARSRAANRNRGGCLRCQSPAHPPVTVDELDVSSCRPCHERVDRRNGANHTSACPAQVQQQRQYDGRQLGCGGRRH